MPSVLILLVVGAMSASAFLITTTSDSDSLFIGHFEVQPFDSLLSWSDSGAIASQYWRGTLNLAYDREYYSDIDRYYKSLLIDLLAGHLAVGSGSGEEMHRHVWFGLGYDRGYDIGGGTTAGFGSNAPNTTGGLDYGSIMFTWHANSTTGTANLYGTVTLSRNYMPGVPDESNTIFILAIALSSLLLAARIYPNKPAHGRVLGI